MSSKKNSGGKKVSGSQKSKTNNTFQNVSKKKLMQSRQAVQTQNQKEKEQVRANKAKTARKHVNSLANKVLDNLDRISIRKKLQQLDKQRASERSATLVIDSVETTPSTTPIPTPQTKSTSNKTKPTAQIGALPAKPLPAHYLSGKTLILGDGDFSFTSSLLQYRSADPQNIVTTTYDTFSQLKYKYKDTYGKHLNIIHNGPTIVINHVDATNLFASFPNPFTSNHYPQGVTPSPFQSVLKIPYPFDRILFNFPHSGEQRVHVNRALLLDFFTSARPHLALPRELSYPSGSSPESMKQREYMDSLLENVKGLLLPKIIQVKKDYNQNQTNNQTHTNPKNPQSGTNNQVIDPFGRIMIVLRDGDPYDGWEVDVQAASALYQLETKFLWEPSWWKFYQHKTTDVSHNALEGGKAHVYIFRLTNIGIAMTLQEIKNNIYPSQQNRLESYFNNLKNQMSSSRSLAKAHTETDPTKIDAKIHLSQWQERAIEKAENRLKQQQNKLTHDAAGVTKAKSLPNSAEEMLFGSSKRKNPPSDGQQSSLKLTQNQTDTLVNRLAALVTPVEQSVQSVIKPSKKKKASVEAQPPAPKKQRIDVVMEGVANNAKSRHLLDQLVQLQPIDGISGELSCVTDITAAKSKKSRTKIDTSTVTPSPTDLFSGFALDEILLLESKLAPEVTQLRLQQDEEKKLQLALVAQQEKIAQEAQLSKAKLKQSKSKNQIDSISSSKTDISKSDDMELSRAILSMLTGTRPVHDDTDDDSDYGNSSDDENDIHQISKKPTPKRSKPLVTKPAPKPVSQTTKFSSGFAGFGTGGIAANKSLLAPKRAKEDSGSDFDPVPQPKTKLNKPPSKLRKH
jgi:hypothetical protein